MSESQNLYIFKVHIFPCAVALSKTRTFFAGEQSFIYDWTASAFEPTATPMPVPKWGAQCGLAKKSDGSEVKNFFHLIRKMI